MKFTRNLDKDTSFWNGVRPLPKEINVLSYHDMMAEFELLSIICTLHGYMTAFDILSGADLETEKDADLTAVLTAFQLYIYPKMPLSNYSGLDKRNSKHSDKKRTPISSDTPII